MTPFPYSLDLKVLTPNRKDARFTFHTRQAVQSVIADLVYTQYESYCYTFWVIKLL